MKEDSKPYKTEEELLSALIAQESQALTYLVNVYSDSIYGIIYNMESHQIKAEELLVLTFLKTYENAKNIDLQKMRLFTHLMQTARKLVKESRTLSYDDNINSDMNLRSSTTVNNRSISMPLDDLLSTLDAEQQAVFHMLFKEGYSPEEIAKEKNKSLTNIRTIVRSTMLKIRELLRIKP